MFLLLCFVLERSLWKSLERNSLEQDLVLKMSLWDSNSLKKMDSIIDQFLNSFFNHLCIIKVIWIVGQAYTVKEPHPTPHPPKTKQKNWHFL
jgi:hypothetical protein